ncbi:hypothetical protein PX699_00090 [Sphingobium sp. H39-3-25]|uniref:hypothetical protein n=1 Tax=Sphingobium arseniciresistens TaxID=3030834 RepID=UPI0023B973E6|nr:hypothetical protein [Sphingobium arseniciresistens]
MAFIDFSQPAAGPAITANPSLATGKHKGAWQDFGADTEAASAQAAFDDLEWQVVALARRDRLSSLRGPSRWSRLVDIIFGQRPNAALADGRLEALRRLAVEAWHHGYAVRPSALSAFEAAGFSIAQLELLLATISAGRSAPGRKTFA